MSELAEQRLATRIESIPFEPDQRSNLRREAPVSPIHISSQGGAATMFTDFSVMSHPGQARLQAGERDSVLLYRRASEDGTCLITMIILAIASHMAYG